MRYARRASLGGLLTLLAIVGMAQVRVHPREVAPPAKPQQAAAARRSAQPQAAHLNSGPATSSPALSGCCQYKAFTICALLAALALPSRRCRTAPGPGKRCLSSKATRPL